MKPSGDGSPRRSVISKLRSLRIELCNLIVESRKPGLKENGYGEGVHCPSLLATNNHRCNPTNAECQRHLKIIQHLQYEQSAPSFEVEVFLLPECCLKDQDCKFDEKVPSTEYLLLEKWHISYSTPFFAKPLVDVQGLLRAVRSFLHFSQLSAWLNVYQGKLPSNIHYRVKVPGDAFPAKFDCKPDVHIFPVVSVAESICGMVRVTYRPRTSQVPIIPCVKHRVSIDVNSNEPGSSVIPLEVCCENNSELAVENNKLNSVRMTKSRKAHHHSMKAERISLKPLIERTPYSKKLFSNQVVKEIVNETLDCYSDIQSNTKEPKTHSLSTILKSNNLLVVENTRNASSAIENISQLPSSQESNITKRKLCKTFQGITKHKFRKLSDDCATHTKNNCVPDSKNITDIQMIESKPKFNIFFDSVKNVIAKDSLSENQKSKTSIFEPRIKNQREVNADESVMQENRKNFSSVDKDRKNEVNINTSQPFCQESNGTILPSPNNLPTPNNLPMCILDTQKSYNKWKNCQGTIDQGDEQPIVKTYAATSVHQRFETFLSKSRVLRDVKNTPGSVNSVTDIESGRKVKTDEMNSSLGQKQGALSLPSSPIPLRRTIMPLNTHISNKALFLEVTSCVNKRSPFQPKLYRSQRLVVNFEESLLNGHLKPVSIVQGFTADIGASGSFCPDHMTLPVEVCFYELDTTEKGTSPYMGHVNLNDLEYHVPKKGAVQVTLFNPHGTVVKMFVVNYDLSDMPPMCHTFVRQRTFYMPSSATEKDPSSGKFLRYIIHIRFASSKTGKIFLYRDFKIVVINRSDVDAASIHSQWQYELRSFIQVPTNPPFSALS